MCALSVSLSAHFLLNEVFDMTKRFSTKELTTLAMITAIAYVLVSAIRIPIVLFLKYEPKDVIITIGGFLMGPTAVLISSAVVALIEMFTISETGIIGCIMNFLSTCSYACVAALIYWKNRTMRGAILGLASGAVFMTAAMLLWNYLITPLYMTGTSRADVAGMLLPVFLPFNLLKAGLNSSITLLLYKPLVNGLRRAGLVAASAPSAAAPGKRSPMVLVFAGMLLAACVLAVLVMRGIL